MRFVYEDLCKVYTSASTPRVLFRKDNSQEKVVARTKDAEKGTIDNPIEILNPFDNLATEENEEADLIQEQISHNPHIPI